MKLSPLSVRLIPTLFALGMGVLFVHLGNWQAGKGERLLAERTQLASRAKWSAQSIGSDPVDALQLTGVPVKVRGRFDAQQQFYIDNRQEAGKPGVHVITPLQIEGGDRRILVNRGWSGWVNGRGNLPQLAPPEGLVEVRGRASVPVAKKFLLMSEHEETSSRLWSQLDLKRFEAAVKYPVQPVVLLQDQDDSKDGLVRNWPAPEDRVAMHESYALQWYGLTLLCAGLWLWFVVIRPGRKIIP